MPSFTSKVKEELSKVPVRSSSLSELAGIVHSCATIILGRGGAGLRVSTENKNIVNLLFSLVKKLYNIDCGLSQTVNQLKKEIYLVDIRSEDSSEIFKDLSIPYGISFEISTESDDFRKLVDTENRKLSYIRGTILGSGVISSPSKDYHMEIDMNSRNMAEILLSLISGFGINAKISERKNSCFVYIKEAQSISDILALTGAHSCVLEIEDIRLTRELRNMTNRQINFENANIDKTVVSAMAQVEAIRKIDRIRGLSYLSPPLREAAELRLSNPEAPLSELAQISGEVSKSGMNNRLRKIIRIADELQ